MYQASDFKGAVFTRTLSAHCVSRACELASSFDKTLSYNTTIIDTYQYHNLLICVPSCRLSGICWASLDADICDSAASAIRTTLLSMLISGLQCDSEDVAMQC